MQTMSAMMDNSMQTKSKDTARMFGLMVVGMMVGGIEESNTDS